MSDTVEFCTRNRPDLTVKIDASDAHVIDACRWFVSKKPRSLTYYVQGVIDRKQIYLHRFIMTPPRSMIINHIDGNGLNNKRSNLEIVTHSENSIHALRVLKRAMGPQLGDQRVDLLLNRVRRRLSDGRVKIYIYDRRERRLLESFYEDDEKSVLQILRAKRVESGD